MKRLIDIVRQFNTNDDLSSATGIAAGRLREIANGSAATMGEAKRISQALRIDLRELASASTNTAQIDFFFRDAQSKSDSVVATKLSSRIASSLKLLPNRYIACPWWLGRFRK